MKRAHLLLKLCYCLNLFGLLLPLAFAGLSSLSSGGDTPPLIALIAAIVGLVLTLIGLYRIGLVLGVPGTLDAWPATGVTDGLHKAGTALVYVGAAVGVMGTLSRPWMHVTDALVGTPALALAAGVGLVGLVLFEFSRLLSFEQRARDELSPQRLRPSPAIEGHSSLDRRKH